MKTRDEQGVPLTIGLLATIEPLKAMKLVSAFEGEKQNKPLSNM